MENRRDPFGEFEQRLIRLTATIMLLVLLLKMLIPEFVSLGTQLSTALNPAAKEEQVERNSTRSKPSELSLPQH